MQHPPYSFDVSTQQGESGTGVPSRVLLAEAVGSFFTVFIGLAALYVSSAMSDEYLSTTRMAFVALAYGLSYSCLLYTLAPSVPLSNVNGEPFPLPTHTAHLNPTVSIALAMLRRLRPGHLTFFLIAQVAGASLAVLVVWIATPEKHYPRFAVLEHVSFAQELTMSVVNSSMVVFLLLVTNFHLTHTTQTNTSNGSSSGSSGDVQTLDEINSIISGLAVFVCCCVGSVVSGGFMNPLLGAGMAALAGQVRLAPLLGPFVGSVVAVMCARLFQQHQHKHDGSGSYSHAPATKSHDSIRYGIGPSPPPL